MPREYESFVQDMLDRARWLLTCTDGKSVEDFQDDLALQDTVIRSLEIIGEAAKHIPEKYRNAHPAIDWQGFSRFRDVIAHSYYRLNLKVIWTSVEEDVPQLAQQLARLIEGDKD